MAEGLEMGIFFICFWPEIPRLSFFVQTTLNSSSSLSY